MQNRVNIGIPQDGSWVRADNREWAMTLYALYSSEASVGHPSEHLQRRGSSSDSTCPFSASEVVGREPSLRWCGAIAMREAEGIGEHAI